MYLPVKYTTSRHTVLPFTPSSHAINLHLFNVVIFILHFRYTAFVATCNCTGVDATDATAAGDQVTTMR